MIHSYAFPLSMCVNVLFTPITLPHVPYVNCMCMCVFRTKPGRSVLEGSFLTTVNIEETRLCILAWLNTDRLNSSSQRICPEDTNYNLFSFACTTPCTTTFPTNCKKKKHIGKILKRNNLKCTKVKLWFLQLVVCWTISLPMCFCFHLSSGLSPTSCFLCFSCLNAKLRY